MQGDLRKELFIAPFVERFKYSDFEKVLIRDCVSARNDLLKHCISAEILLIES